MLPSLHGGKRVVETHPAVCQMDGHTLVGASCASSRPRRALLKDEPRTLPPAIGLVGNNFGKMTFITRGGEGLEGLAVM